MFAAIFDHGRFGRGLNGYLSRAGLTRLLIGWRRFLNSGSSLILRHFVRIFSRDCMGETGSRKQGQQGKNDSFHEHSDLMKEWLKKY